MPLAKQLLRVSASSSWHQCSPEWGLGLGTSRERCSFLRKWLVLSVSGGFLEMPECLNVGSSALCSCEAKQPCCSQWLSSHVIRFRRLHGLCRYLRAVIC